MTAESVMTVVRETTVLKSKCQLCPSLVCSCIWTVVWLLVLHWPGIAAKDVPTQEASAALYCVGRAGRRQEMGNTLAESG